MIIRFLFGFEGEALVQGESNEAARATSQQLTNFLEQISDADNDGIVDFLENRAPLVTLQALAKLRHSRRDVK